MPISFIPFRWFLSLAPLVTAWQNVAAAQNVHLEFFGRGLGWRLGSVQSIGDLDQDGVPDLVLGALGGGPHGGGVVMTVSGTDGHNLHPPLYGPFDYLFGFYVAGVGDFDGDGVPDFANGAPDNGSFANGEAYVWSGADSSLLAFIDSPYGPSAGLGWGVFGLGDLNQDGFDDIAVTARGPGDVLLYGGPDGQLLRIHREGLQTGVWDPWVASIGDVDTDQVPDYVVGWRYGARAIVFSGASGCELFRVEQNVQGFAQNVARVGDADGDMIPDFAVNVTLAMECQGYDPDRGLIRLYSGADGSVVREIEASRVAAWSWGCDFYRIHSDGHDVNGDGIGDIIAGSPDADREFDPVLGVTLGSLYSIFSGATGTMLWQQRALNRGIDCALVGDLTRDGISEFAVGSTWDYTTYLLAGKITVFEGARGDATRVCPVNSNSTGQPATLHLDGPISIGNNRLHLFVENAVPNEPGYLVYGLGSTGVPFGDGVLCAGSTSSLLCIGGPVLLDSQGEILVPVDMTQGPMADPATAWLPGSKWTLQFLYRDPAGPGGTGFNLSDAMRVTFTP